LEKKKFKRKGKGENEKMGIMEDERGKTKGHPESKQIKPVHKGGGEG
jgi:hypothetical protein